MVNYMGTTFTLPCELNSTIYLAMKDKTDRIRWIVPYEVVGVHLTVNSKYFEGKKNQNYLVCLNHNTGHTEHFDVNKVGTQIFLTAEEAERWKNYEF